MQRVERTIVCPLVPRAAHAPVIAIDGSRVIFEYERWHYNATTSRQEKHVFIYAHFLMGAQPSKFQVLSELMHPSVHVYFVVIMHSIPV